MIGEQKLFKKLESILGSSKADHTEIVFIGNNSALTRYANSQIHQNAAENNHIVSFRTVVDKRIGIASTNSMSSADLKQALNDSIEIAKQQPASPDFPGLAKPTKYKTLDTFDEATAKFSAIDRANVVKRIIAESDAKGFTVAGSLATSHGEIAVLNTNGVRAYQPTTAASVICIPMADTSSGYTSDMSRKISEIDFDALAKTAVAKCEFTQNPKQIEPDTYEVILEPPAVAEMMEWLNYVSFGSRPYERGMSFLSGREGKKVTSDQITIYDDALSSKSVAFPFDMEGTPKKRVYFVKNGIAGGPVHDRTSAFKAGKRSTGHAVTPDESERGAFAMNIHVAPGQAKRADMISKVKKGILVTRFHYINGLIDPRNSVLTGMTRDGTFWIENGEIRYGIKNLRFTDNIMKALATVKAISKETSRVESWWSAVGCMNCPTIHLGKFRFSGKTEH